jgi:uncharacterized membrane-anchored protein YjiN (DUF445 family)
MGVIRETMTTVARQQPISAGTPPPVPPRKDEATRRAELKTMQRAATGLLVLALGIFLLAFLLEPRFPWLGYVRATAEASLVGGLADWFAVTALFRQPLGLPIPHTAIIPRQKDRIGKILGSFVQNHFLTHDVLAARLRSMSMAERAAAWISDPANSARLAGHLAAGVAQTVQALPEADVREFIRDSAVANLHSVRLAPVLGNLLSAVTTDDRHQALLDEVLKLVRDGLDKNREQLRQKIREESPRWVPGFVDDAFHTRLLAATQRLVDDVSQDPAHPLRLKFDVSFRNFVERLKHSPDVIARTEELKQDLLGRPVVEELASSLWDRARQAAVRFSAEQDGKSLEPLGRGIKAIGESLLGDPARLAELDDFLTAFIASLLDRHRQEVSDLIAETVRQWDPELAADRIELAVGRDLQFIRLNGTLVGGLAGLIIYTVTKLLR